VIDSITFFNKIYISGFQKRRTNDQSKKMMIFQKGIGFLGGIYGKRKTKQIQWMGDFSLFGCNNSSYYFWLR